MAKTFRIRLVSARCSLCPPRGISPNWFSTVQCLMFFCFAISASVCVCLFFAFDNRQLAMLVVGALACFGMRRRQRKGGSLYDRRAK